MKIISYNVNGIRAAMQKGLVNFLSIHNPDVLCVQEIKANEEDIDTTAFEELGYHSYFFSAQKKGYSGVGILSKIKPLEIMKGNEYQQSNDEGRVLMAVYKNFSVLSVYMPSGTTGDLRQNYKYQWLDEFLLSIKKIEKKYPQLIICGDYNICHQAIDIHDPKNNAKSSGFLPKERAWIDKFLNSGFVDSFRYKYPNLENQYSWWSFRSNARLKNKGWRIDYISVTKNLSTYIKEASILFEEKHSDHCPIEMDITLQF
ncbi:MAG: exodeoxyribonuclease III [Chitinophagaceae bacterium]